MSAPITTIADATNQAEQARAALAAVHEAGERLGLPWNLRLSIVAALDLANEVVSELAKVPVPLRAKALPTDLRELIDGGRS